MDVAPRPDGRGAAQLRPVKILPNFVGSADGSCLIEMGGTRVICTASVTPGVPAWRAGRGQGWVTAEYGMLPASTGSRKSRPLGKPDSRATEIQRLIGRAIRSVVRFDKLRENTIHLDCDVLEADGGTRTAAITGAYVALALAVAGGAKAGRFARGVLVEPVAAASVGIVKGRALLDLCYQEDSAADVDMNVAMTGGGKFLELQATAEKSPFDGSQLSRMLSLARGGIRELLKTQQRVIRRETRR